MKKGRRSITKSAPPYKHLLIWSTRREAGLKTYVMRDKRQVNLEMPQDLTLLFKIIWKESGGFMRKSFRDIFGERRRSTAIVENTNLLKVTGTYLFAVVHMTGGR